MLSLLSSMATLTDLFPSLCQGVLVHRRQAHKIRAVGHEIAGLEPANRDQEDIHALERYGGLRVAVPLLDHGQLHGMAILAVAREWFQRMNKRRFVPIGKRTSDKGVRVLRNGLSRCAAALPYLAGFFALPSESFPAGRWSGQWGR